MAGNYGPSASSKFTVPSVIGWGNACGSNATSAVLPATSPGSSLSTGQYFDVGPFREFTTEARIAASSTSVTNNVVTASSVTTTFVGTITAGTSHNVQSSNAESGSVGEAFLAFTTSKHSATTIANQVTSTVSGSLTVASGAALPSAPFYAQMNNEVILVGTVSTNTLTISRAQNGSTANASAVGDGVVCGNIPGTTPNTNNGDMFAHAGFTSLALNSGDSIQFTWNISVTS